MKLFIVSLRRHSRRMNGINCIPTERLLRLLCCDAISCRGNDCKTCWFEHSTRWILSHFL